VVAVATAVLGLAPSAAQASTYGVLPDGGQWVADVPSDNLGPPAVPRQRGRSQLDGVVRLGNARRSESPAWCVRPPRPARSLTSSGGARRAIAMATKRAPGSPGIGAATDDRIRPRGGVRSDTCGGPAMAKIHRCPATSTRFWFVAIPALSIRLPLTADCRTMCEARAAGKAGPPEHDDGVPACRQTQGRTCLWRAYASGRF
jgi:hypothetical protein